MGNKLYLIPPYQLVRSQARTNCSLSRAANWPPFTILSPCAPLLKGEELVFTIRQFREELSRPTLAHWPGAAEVVHQALGDGRAKDGLAAGHRPNGPQGLLLHGSFEEVAARVGAPGDHRGRLVPAVLGRVFSDQNSICVGRAAVEPSHSPRL
jgi:hypothetical protein